MMAFFNVSTCLPAGRCVDAAGVDATIKQPAIHP